MSTTRILAEFAIDPDDDLINDRSMHAASRVVRDGIGVGIRAAGTPMGIALISAFSKESGPHAVLGSTERVGGYAASLQNGALIHAEDFDDMGGCGGHDTAALLPGLLAISEEISLSGEDLLRAYIVGYQCGNSLSRNMELGYHGFDRPWHPSGVIGPIAAACACGAALRLTVDEMVGALGIAAAFAGGLRGNFGSDAKPLQLGHASSAGYLAATLARSGLRGDEEILERSNGYVGCFSPGANMRHLQHDLARQRYIESEDDRFPAGYGPSIKPWPVCGGNNLALTAVHRALTGSHRDRAEIVSIRVVENLPRRGVSLFRDEIRRPFEGKFSIPFSVALLAWYGDVTPDMFISDDSRTEVIKNGFLDKVKWEYKESASGRPDEAHCWATVTYEDGTELRAEARGRGRVLDDVEALEKFSSCVVPTLGEGTAQELAESLGAIAKMSNVAELLPLCVPKQ